MKDSDYGEDDPSAERYSSVPINLRERRTHSDESGVIIVRFKQGEIANEDNDLRTAARKAGKIELADTLDRFELPAQPLITSISSEQLRKLEENAKSNERFAPGHSLSSYWRLDARDSKHSLDEIEEALRRRPEVEL